MTVPGQRPRAAWLPQAKSKRRSADLAAANPESLRIGRDNARDAAAAAGRQCQVIILTCTPGRYAHIGNATTIRLPSGPQSRYFVIFR